jgi:uncharacterized protein (TIGR01777 family)
MKRGAWTDEVGACDAVINLVGEPIFGRRWNEEFKTLLRASRVTGSENVVQAIRESRGRDGKGPKVLVNASAIGFYGPHGDEELSESSPPGDDFLARLTVDWEKAAQEAASTGVRVASVRIGVVLDKAGGALAQMLMPFKLGVGGPVGSGRQYMSWIHHADMVGILLLALDSKDASGALNGTAPDPVTNKGFSKALGRALWRPAFMPTPRFALRLALGEVANVITTGQRVIPQRTLALGYQFQFPEIAPALADILR